MELDWLKRWNQFSPRACAIQDGETGLEFNYAELYSLANRSAGFLQEHYQISQGQRVACLATNELEYVFLFFALQRLGAILVPINFRLTQREVDHIVRDAQPDMIIFQAAFSELIENLPRDVRPAHLLLLQAPIEKSPALNGKWLELVKASATDNFAAKIRSRPFSEVPFAGTDESPVMILYTSGTTGAPKGAIISQRMIFWNSINTTMRLNLSQSDCTVIFLPFFHTGGWNVLTTPLLHRGGKVVFLKKFDADQILSLCTREKSTILFGVPTTMDMMARSNLFNKIDLSSIRYAITGGEPMPIPLIQTWEKKGVPIRQGYGLTECGPNVFSLNEEDSVRKIGSIGFPNFYVQAEIKGIDGNFLGANQVGELVMRGPMLMSGYWQNETATRETIQDGWIHTGDLVRRDSEGYYYVVGRKKEMYISGGENVYPTELEQVLRTCPGVREVAVVGVPDEKWGEVGRAFIVRDGPDLTEERLRSHCLQNLAKFKIPKYFNFLESLPKGDSGKVPETSIDLGRNGPVDEFKPKNLGQIS